MSIPRNATLSEAIFNTIDKNPYLQEIYKTILFNYSMKTLGQEHRNKPISIDDALRFADILSKSSGHKNSEKHRTWSQEIVALLNYLYPQNPKVKAYASSVLANIGNYRGLQLIKTQYKTTSFLEELYKNFDMDYLTIPYQDNKYFFHSQKEIYDHLEDQTFSYSGPTSMGKSLLMRMFIKDKILNGFTGNFAILVPTKALITEISSNIVNEDLKNDLASHNYKVVTSGNSLFLKQDNLNYIMVVTPERMLYMLMSYPNISIDYLFIDEAHKISEADGRSAFYYKVTDMLIQRERKPKIILASPNIPNPQVYLKALPYDQNNSISYLKTSFTPVSQMKYYLDILNHKFYAFNERAISSDESFFEISGISQHATYFSLIQAIINKDITKSNIIYCSGRERAVDLARQYAASLPYLNDQKLDALAKEVEDEIHGSYYLADLIKKGVAYHVGYLPLHIRTTIEENYRNKNIKTIFCTSTLIEGVNLPADNLFILSYRNGQPNMSPVEFRNLIGRVGRIEYNLYGNVFIIRHSESQSEKKIKELLEKDIPEQKISITTGLNESEKKYIVSQLKNGSTEFTQLQDQNNESYDLMRKVGLILVRDITKDRNSVVKKSFNDYLDSDSITLIKHNFLNTNDDKPKPDDDINVSLDQTQNLIVAIKGGLTYPALKNGKVDYNDLLSFLNQLSRIFRWDMYEKDTVGSNRLRYYAVLLTQWMDGYGLSQIMQQAIDWNKNNFGSVKIHGQLVPYNNSQDHQNIVIGDALGIIENVILFSIANYFLRFSTEYKKLITAGAAFDNDWYEYVEFGSTNPLTIFFQRNGITRDTSDYIRRHHEYYIQTQNGYRLKSDVLSCGKESVEKELKEIQYNVPELFV